MKILTLILAVGMVGLLASIAYAQPQPVGHWPFNEGQGETTADVSGNGNDGLIWDDGVFWSADTPSGSGFSLEFAGKVGAVHIGDPEILKIVGDITLAAWIKTGPATENWQNVVVKGHGNSAEIVMRVDGNTNHTGTEIWCGSYDGADHMARSAALTDDYFNTWIHVVGTYNSDDLYWSLYLNGEWVSEVYDEVGAVLVDRPWAIGARANSTNMYPHERHFEGFIDDVRIKIFNSLGQEILTLVDAEFEAGTYDFQWDGHDLYGNKVESGIYLYQVITERFTQSIKMVLLQ